MCYDYAIKETNALYAAAIKNGYSVTEEDYWNYEFSVYEKNLPIQNYVADLECSYAQEEHLVQGSEEFQQKWLEHFQSLKTQLVEQQNYTRR